MMDALGSWWGARSSRERLIIRIAALLLFAVLAPAVIYQKAATFRSAAASELAASRALLADVGKIQAAGPPPPKGGDRREVALAAAASNGLVIERVESIGADGLVVVFGPSDSRGLFRWIDDVGRNGVVARRTAIVRADDGLAASAEFEIGARR